MKNKRIFEKIVLIIGLIIIGVAVSYNLSYQKLSPDFEEPRVKKKVKYKEAYYYKKLKNKEVRCKLCPRQCVIPKGQRGFCRVRENINGKLYTLVYSLPVAVHVDPIEKKPLFHFLPSTSAFSIATAGCNLRCSFCQNWQISQAGPEEADTIPFAPKAVVKRALHTESATIAYTYTEPIIFYEYMLDTAKLAKKFGLKNIMHTCGYVNPEPVRELAKYLDGANVDLKSFSDKFYKRYTGGGSGVPKQVLKTLKVLKEEGVWIEITNLIIPNLNDNDKEIRNMCIWIKKNLGPNVPLHFSRFYPAYKMRNLPPTPVQTLERAKKIAEKVGLKFVYIGNVPGHPAENTYCPKCKRLLIRRRGYQITEYNLNKGRCKFCGKKIPGVWK